MALCVLHHCLRLRQFQTHARHMESSQASLAPAYTALEVTVAVSAVSWCTQTSSALWTRFRFANLLEVLSSASSQSWRRRATCGICWSRALTLTASCRCALHAHLCTCSDACFAIRNSACTEHVVICDRLDQACSSDRAGVGRHNA